MSTDPGFATLEKMRHVLSKQCYQPLYTPQASPAARLSKTKRQRNDSRESSALFDSMWNDDDLMAIDIDAIAIHQLKSSQCSCDLQNIDHTRVPSEVILPLQNSSELNRDFFMSSGREEDAPPAPPSSFHGEMKMHDEKAIYRLRSELRRLEKRFHEKYGDAVPPHAWASFGGVDSDDNGASCTMELTKSSFNMADPIVSRSVGKSSCGAQPQDGHGGYQDQEHPSSVEVRHVTCEGTPNCDCGRPCGLRLMSRSDNNPNRPFWRCNQCNFFQWCDSGMAAFINTGTKFGESLTKPPDADHEHGRQCIQKYRTVGDSGGRKICTTADTLSFDSCISSSSRYYSPVGGCHTGFKDPVDENSEIFGHRGFRPGQREVVDIAMQGRDVFCLMPTGG